MTIAQTTRPTANHATIRTLTSLRSCPNCSAILLRLQPFVRQDGLLFCEAEKEREPDATERNRQADVQPMQIEAVWMKTGRDLPEIDDQIGGKNQERDPE